jgi:hypothetical protein
MNPLRTPIPRFTPPRGQDTPLLPQVNRLDLLQDAGQLGRLTDASSLLPLTVVVGTLVVFLVATAAASRLDGCPEREGARETHAVPLSAMSCCTCEPGFLRSLAPTKPCLLLHACIRERERAQARCGGVGGDGGGAATCLAWHVVALSCPLPSSPPPAADLRELRKAHLLTYGFVRQGLGMGVLHLPEDHPDRVRMRSIEASLMVRP